MIEVEGEILRGSCTPVFFVGETVECEIKFRFKSNQETNKYVFNVAKPQSRASLKDSTVLNGEIEKPAEQVIAWACAQIDCNCFIDESKVMLPLRYNINNDVKAADVSTTSFQPNKDRVGISIFSSKPKILFCNLKLRPGEVKSFFYKERLPYDLAPSFRGQFAKFSYKLTVGVQKLGKTTQLLRLPFRVFSLLDFDKYIPPNINVPLNEEIDFNNKTESLSETLSTNDSYEIVKDSENPFRIKEKSEFEDLEYALQILEDITARSAANTYNVVVQDKKIVKIHLNKTNYKIGDKLVAYLDFSEAEASCLEFKATLQSEEIIAEECRKKSNQTLSNAYSHVEIKEHCLFLKKTSFTIQIPVHLTPTFVSDIISLRWRLRFDFALSQDLLSKINRSNDPAMSVSWFPPNSLNVEVISWDLPISIHPCDPFIASDLIYTNNQQSDINNLIIN